MFCNVQLVKSDFSNDSTATLKLEQKAAHAEGEEVYIKCHGLRWMDGYWWCVGAGTEC